MTTVAKDPHYRSIGEANLSNMRDLLRSLSWYPVTQRQVRDPEQFKALIDAASAELGNIDAKPYLRLYVVSFPAKGGLC